MNKLLAYEILEIKDNSTEKQIKIQYHKLALKYHPDRNSSISDEKFKNINEAYHFLKNESNSTFNLNKNEENQNNYTFNFNNCNYKTLLFYFLNNIDNNITINDIDNIIIFLSNKCRDKVMNIFKNLEQDKLLLIYDLLDKNKDIFNIDNSLIDELKSLINNNNEIIISPTLIDLFHKNVYILNFKEETYYIPLWQNEVIFENNNNNLIIKCIPNLDNHINIDEFNNIYFNIKVNLNNKILESGFINVNICKDKFIKINLINLKLQKKQIYILHNQGIPRIDLNDIYNDNDISDLILNIELNI